MTSSARRWFRSGAIACLILWLVTGWPSFQAVSRAADVPPENLWRTNPDLLPLCDCVVIKFDRPLDELRPPRKFGIFRDTTQSRSVQWIDESHRAVALPGHDRSFGFLDLHYEVPGWGSYNGWWLKLEDADWRRFRQWSLVLRLRQGEPCTNRFKIELKAREGGSDHLTVFPAVVNVSRKHLAEMKERGFFDAVVPLRPMVGQGDMSRMGEFVIVFEHNRVDVAKGDLWVHSIRLAAPDDREAQRDVNALLDELARRAFLWFEDHRSGTTGLVLDRCRNSPVCEEPYKMASIATAGYYLSMLPEAERTRQISRQQAEERALKVVSYALNNLKHYHGFFHHFLNVETGRATEGSEISCLDSAIFFNGCMVVAEAYGGQIAELANTLLDRADWPQFIVKHPKTHKDVLSLGWKSRKGLLGPMDVRSSEMAMAYFLAVGSRSHPIDPQCWYNTSVTFGEVQGHKVLNARHPLFTSYYGLGWHDLKGRVDKDGVDLDANARQAALANRTFCRGQIENSMTYSEALGGWWGISAGDSPSGYVAPELILGDARGTVWPVASLAAVPWLPSEIETDLDNWRNSPLWPIVSGTYGLAPFNLDVEWVGRDLIGIDLGSFYINLANHRNGTIQRLWMRHPVAKLALERLEYRKASNVNR